MYDVKTIASYFIDRASSESNENDLTNLKLQKILYYTQAEHVRGNNGNAIFSENIEAWEYGPVVRSVYHWLKGCGAYPITAFDVQTDTSSLSAADLPFLDRVWAKYSKYSAGFLVKKTHEEGSPWDKSFKAMQSTIPLDSLKDVKLANEWTE
jgi:uncharacterized phage-associated protein